LTQFLHHLPPTAYPLYMIGLTVPLGEPPSISLFPAIPMKPYPYSVPRSSTPPQSSSSPAQSPHAKTNQHTHCAAS
ncbi:MAG: hypothetical protein ACK5TA_02560, partial [bacterium]